MDFALSDEQEALRELARKILEEGSPPARKREVEERGGFDRELWGELARSQLLGIAIPERFGGSGLGFFDLALLLEEVGRAVAPLPAWPTLVLGALAIAEFGNDAQRERWLPRVANGECVLTAGLEDPVSAPPDRPTLRAARDGAGWRLEGERLAVPAAPIAERVIVPATDAGGGVGLFLVDPGARGVRLERELATHRQPQGRLRLEGAPVGADDVLVAPPGGEEALAWLLERAVAGLCALEVGVAERALRMTAEYVSGREQFGRPIGSFQAVHQRAADAYIDLQAMRLTAWQAAWRLERERHATPEVAVAKFWACRGGHRIVYAAQHLHGGIGVDVDYPLHRYTLWTRAIELALGGAAQQLERLGAWIAELPPEAE